jgi:hypothetical protein
MCKVALAHELYVVGGEGYMKYVCTKCLKIRLGVFRCGIESLATAFIGG